MSAEKSELKALIADGFAAEFLDSRDKSHRSVALHRGAAEGLAKAEQVVNAVTQETRNELVEKGIPFDAADPIAVGKFVVGRLMEAVRKLHELAENASLSSVRAEGELRAYEVMVNRLAGAASKERAKAQGLRRAEEAAGRNGNGEAMRSQTELAHVGARPEPRLPGTHPGPPIKAQRQESEPQRSEPAKSKSEGSAKPARKASKAKTAKGQKKTANA